MLESFKKRISLMLTITVIIAFSLSSVETFAAADNVTNFDIYSVEDWIRAANIINNKSYSNSYGYSISLKSDLDFEGREIPQIGLVKQQPNFICCIVFGYNHTIKNATKGIR